MTTVELARQAASGGDLLDRTFVECSALGFQSVVTSVLAVACVLLWQRSRQPFLLTWAVAWSAYVIRLACMSAFLVRRDEVWLFLHQVFTGVSALLLLLSAFQYARGIRLQARHALAVPLSVLWAWFAIYGMGSMFAAGVTSTILLTAITTWTGVVFWRTADPSVSQASRLFGVVFIVWGLHHLDYPWLRGFGAAVLYGVFVDVMVLFGIALGLLVHVLAAERHRLSERSAELEQLTRLMLRVQEDERRRIARELHDEAGQALTAVKISLELDGRTGDGALVGRVLNQVRDLSNLLRPSALDDLGLSPALRALAEDVAARTRVTIDVSLDDLRRALAPEQEVAIYRVVQEGLTNVVRHARATRARVAIASDERGAEVVIEDNGQGLPQSLVPHLGWLGMRERVAALGGRISMAEQPTGGVKVAAWIPHR